jgi:tetratricopeptide (TPR) repeat protein
MNFFRIIFKIIFSRGHRRYFISFNRALFYATYKNDYPKAIQEYKSLLENDAFPLKAKVYRNLGRVYFWNGNFDEAEKALTKSLELTLKNKGHDPELYEYMGKICIKKGKYERALMFFEQAARFGSEGFLNRHLTDLEYVNKMKKSLEEHKEELPFLTAYFEQNKERFGKQDNSKPQ